MSSEHDFDLLIVADVTRYGDVGFRIRREIELYADMSLSVGLLHLPLRAGGRGASPDIASCVQRGLATIVSPEDPVRVALALVFSPGAVKTPTDAFRNVRAERTVLIVDRVPVLDQMGLWATFQSGRVTWAPTNRWVRSKMLQLHATDMLAAEDWRPVANAVPVRSEPVGPRVLGRVSADTAAQWPKTQSALNRVYDLGPDVQTLFLGGAPAAGKKALRLPETSIVLGPEDITIARFLRHLDALAYVPSARAPELPDAAIAEAMAMGLPVVLPPRFAPHFGPGAVYAPPEQTGAEVRRLFEDADALAEVRQAAIHHAGFQFARAPHLARIERLLDRPLRKRRKRKAKVRPRVLFVPSNGVGLGHVTRTLAIAQRLQDRAEPVFATLAQASDLIEAAGFAAEYLPSHSSVGGPFEDWDAWFGHQLGQLVTDHRPQAVVFDGNHASPGLLKAVLPHDMTKLVWVRRGMFGQASSRFMAHARLMDIVIEPGEIASAQDFGETAFRRDETRPVPPIGLLDPDACFTRQEARADLGLDPEKPAVLVHLGGAALRDVGALVEQVVAHLAAIEGLQIVIADWVNGAQQMPAFPGCHILHAYPLSRYFHAFDFSIAAAGYNTFHEVVRFGLPTIFIANTHAQMDSQSSRAQFAQDNHLGFNLPQGELFHLPTLCEALLTPQVHAFMQAQCQAQQVGNGAAEAAEAILALMEVA